MSYRYDLIGTIKRDFVPEQIAQLQSEGFIENPSTGYMEKYREIHDDKIWFDFEYEEDTEVEVKVSRYLKKRAYEVTYTEKIKKSVPINRYLQKDDLQITYKEIRNIPEPVLTYEVIYEGEEKFQVSYVAIGDSAVSRFFGFFRKAFNIRKQETGIEIGRLELLKNKERLGEITGLNSVVMDSGKRNEELTRKEAEKISRNRPVRLISDEVLRMKDSATSTIDAEVIPADYLRIFQKDRNKEIVSMVPLKETIDLTVKEFIDSGESLKLLQKNVSSKEEEVEVSGKEIVPEDAYIEFMEGKSLIEKTEKNETIDLTAREYLSIIEEGDSYKLLEKNIGTKKEIEIKKGERSFTSEEYDLFKKGKRITKENRRVERILKDKILIDSRRRMEQTVKVYQPGVWSHGKNHDDGSRADFGATIEISHMSGFSAFDADYYDQEEITEEIIEIIQKEHYSAILIRDRNDQRDGYKIEKPRL